MVRESTKHSPADRGEVALPGRCQICGREGDVIAVPEAPAPNQFCPRCAIEYGPEMAADEDLP